MEALTHYCSKQGNQIIKISEVLLICVNKGNNNLTISNKGKINNHITIKE